VNAIWMPARPAHTDADPAGARGGLARLRRARPDDPAWARPALLVLLLATGALYLAGLSRNGWANEFYAAAVQAGTKSWTAFLFGSLDSSNFITVDKTPAFLWVMELSARIFGLNSWSLLVPQALEGVAAVGVLYTTVRRWFGPAAAIIAGAVMAVTPVATLMFRFDNPDALLVLVLTLAAYATTRAIESGLTRWLALAGALLGLGYLTKMLQAFLVLPAFALAYLWAGRPSLGKRIWQLLAGGAALAATAGWWVAIDLLTPAASRPYVGGSTDNNILQLTFGYNGLSRLTGSEAGPGAGGSAGRRLVEGLAGPGASGGGPGGSPFSGATGIIRLFRADIGGQVSWLIPAALIGLAVMLWVSRRAGRTDRTRAAALMWGGWLLVTGLVFSYMSGISHPYYTVALAPAIGALVGIGGAGLWRVRHTRFARVALAAALALTGGWAWVLLDRTPGWLPWLRVVIVIAAVAAAGLIVAGPALRAPTVRGRTALAAAAASLALVAGLAGPLAYSIDTASTAHGGSIPSAGPTVAAAAGGPGGGTALGRGAFPGGPGGTNTVRGAVINLLKAGAPGYRWVAATVGSTSAAALELSTGGRPVMAIGGFSGSDPAPSLAEFEKLVAEHKIHYFIGGGSGGSAGGSGDSSQITSWVRKYFTARTVDGMTVYDLTAPAA
jgi:4-amino-4-deoxy-L-arabinose transferase-like glycosyltransferase